MKTLTRKQAERLLEKKFGDVNNLGKLGGCHIGGLCDYLPEELRPDFHKYWEKINTYDMATAWLYFENEPTDYAERSILRLLTAHFFIEDSYK